MATIEQQLDSVKVNGVTYINIEKLHTLLGCKGRYRDWIKSVLGYGFEEGTDYIYLTDKEVINNDYYREIYRDNNDSQLEERASRARYYYGTINMCKELCMISKSDKGREIRKYYISLEEKVLNNLQLKHDNVVALLDGYKEKADVLDKIMASETYKPITTVAVNYGLSGSQMNELLRLMGIIKHCGGEWVFNIDKYDNLGYAKTSTGYATKKDGDVYTYHYLVWSERGREFIREKLEDYGVKQLD